MTRAWYLDAETGNDNSSWLPNRLFDDQPISIAVRLADVDRVAGIGLELVAKPKNEVVHGAREWRVGT